MPVGFDARVARPLIISCKFKYLVNKVKHFITAQAMLNRSYNFCVPVLLIVLTFFLVFCPFLVENSFAFPFHFAPNYSHSNILFSEELSNKFRIIVSGIGETSSFNQMLEWRHGILKRVESFLFSFFDVPQNNENNSSNSAGYASKDTKNSEDITTGERSKVLKIWFIVAQFLSLMITLYIILRSIR